MVSSNGLSILAQRPRKVFFLLTKEKRFVLPRRRARAFFHRTQNLADSASYLGAGEGFITKARMPAAPAESASTR